MISFKKLSTQSIMLKNLIWLLALATLVNCNGKPAAERKNSLVIAVAANVQFAAQEMKQVFEQKNDATLELIISSSGKLTAQMLQGAPYDVFISADMKYPDSLYANGFATAPPRVYALGALVLWSCSDVPVSDDLSMLQSENVRKIAIANPATAPYGEQTVRLLRHYNLYHAVESKLVYGESIAQTNQYITSGAADVGFTAKSIVLAPPMQGKGEWLEMDAAAYEPIRQGAVVTTHGAEQHPETSEAFVAFLFGNDGRAILEKYGYQLPPKNE